MYYQRTEIMLTVLPKLTQDYKVNEVTAMRNRIQKSIEGDGKNPADFLLTMTETTDEERGYLVMTLTAEERSLN